MLPQSESSLPRDLPRLTSLRAFAALAVFGFHLSQGGPRWTFLETVLGDGYAGVAFFFVLSGFVLTWATSPATSAAAFYRRRLARIYPSHLVTAVGAIVLGSAVSLSIALPNVLLLQSWTGTDRIVFGMNGVSWSLSCEAFFYAAFPLILWLLNRSTSLTSTIVVSAGYTALTAVLTIVIAQAGPGWQNVAYTNPLCRSGEFVLGVALAIAVQAGWRPRVSVRLAVLFVLTSGLISRIIEPTVPLPDLLLLPSFALLITAAAVADTKRRGGWLVHPALLFAGQVSFAFYLVHALVTQQVVEHVHIGATGLAILSLLTSAVVAIALHKLVERPAQRWLSPRQAAMAATSAGAPGRICATTTVAAEASAATSISGGRE